MNEKNEQKMKTSHHRALRVVAQWGVVALVTFALITEMYLSLYAYMGQDTQIFNYENWQSPIALTIVVLIIFGIAYILYHSGPSKDGAWTIMTGPYVR